VAKGIKLEMVLSETAIERHMDPQGLVPLWMVEEEGPDYGRSWCRDPDEHQAFMMKGKPRSR
jgi:hypothetical protein